MLNSLCEWFLIGFSVIFLPAASVSVLKSDVSVGRSLCLRSSQMVCLPDAKSARLQCAQLGHLCTELSGLFLQDSGTHGSLVVFLFKA